ncbi:hypothetical protein MMC34_002796, partial [Xylographa carneopallida]|nr:hypothetical protein [Xylographa carneopallida]
LYSSALRVSEVDPKSHTSPHAKRQDASSTPCGFPGNTDLYGLGIRIGYYTQAFASWLGNFFVLQESKTLRPVNTLFMLAMFIGLVWISHSPSETFAVEAFLLLQLLLTTWFVGVKDRSKWTTRYWRYDPVRAAIREVSVIAILAYNVWFWWKALDAFNPTPCGTYIFFLGKVDLYGWYRSAHKVLSIVSICFQTIMAAGDAVQLLAYWQNRKTQSSEYFTELAAHLLRARGARTRRPPTPASIVCAPTVEKRPRLGYQDRACSPILECAYNRQASPPAGSKAPTCSWSYSSSKNSFGVGKHASCTTQDTGIDSISTASTLPTSPTSLPKPPQPRLAKANSHISNPPPATTTTSLPSFEDLHKADTYISFVLPPPSSTLPGTHSFHLSHTPLKLALPTARALLPAPIPLSLLRHLPPTFPLLAPLFTHIYSLHQHPFPTYPSLLTRALTAPHRTTIAPSTLITVLLLRTARLPAHNRKWYYLPSALLTLVVAVGLVLAIELSIVWNGIAQMGGMGAVGQLVPFVLGVGGLLKVVWSWGWEGSGEEEGRDAAVEAVERCAEVYFKEKERRTKGLGLRVGV